MLVPPVELLSGSLRNSILPIDNVAHAQVKNCKEVSAERVESGYWVLKLLPAIYFDFSGMAEKYKSAQ